MQPVLIRGRVDHIDGTTGELLHRYTTVHEPGGVLPIACKTRRATRCPPCAETYRADTYQLIRAGLTGGKGIPATVAAHPAAFLTLTAPSFGPVHARRERNGRVLRCRPRRAPRPCPTPWPASLLDEPSLVRSPWRSELLPHLTDPAAGWSRMGSIRHLSAAASPAWDRPAAAGCHRKRRRRWPTVR